MSQIFALIGPNRYAIMSEKKRWEERFKEKYGEENLLRRYGKETSIREIIDDIAIAPFLSEKRLCILDGLPRAKKGDGEKVLQSIHPSTILLVLLETELGPRAKRTIAEKELIAIADVREFPTLAEAKLKEWMHAIATEYGSTIAPDAMQLLLTHAAGDQFLLSTELHKICLYASGQEVVRDDVESLSVCRGEREVWQLLDLLGAGKTNEALQYIQMLQEQGVNVGTLWASFLWMMSTLVQVKSAIDSGTTDTWQIARDLRLRGSSVKSLVPLARKLSHAKLHTIISHIVDADRGLKTGEYRATAAQPIEHCALFDRCILALS